MRDTSVLVPNSGTTAIDAEADHTDAGDVTRQRITVTGELLRRLVEGVEALAREQRFTNALLKREFRSDLSIDDLKG